MRKLISTAAALLCLLSLTACIGDDHDHGPENDHNHSTPDHHETIE